MKNNKHNKAFTILEVMITIACIILLSAIIIPSFLKARETAKANEANEVAKTNNTNNSHVSPPPSEIITNITKDTNITKENVTSVTSQLIFDKDGTEIYKLIEVTNNSTNIHYLAISSKYGSIALK